MRAAPLTLEAGELRSLTALLAAPTQANRAVVVLLAAQGLRNVEIAARVGLSNATVGKWRNRYATHGIGGLADQPRPGAPRTVDRSEILAATFAAPPSELGITHWSTRRLANYLGVSDATVARVWREYGIAPRPNAEFTFATEPEFTTSGVEVAGVLLLSQAKIIALSGPRLPAFRSQLSNVSPPAGPVITIGRTARHRVRRQVDNSTWRTDEASREFIARVARTQPGRTIRLVASGLAPESATRINRLAATHPGLELHTVDQPGRWLNLAEIWCQFSTSDVRGWPSSRLRELAESGQAAAWITSNQVGWGLPTSVGMPAENPREIGSSSRVGYGSSSSS